MARRDGCRGSGCSLAGTTLALGESKTLKQRRCAACGGMHVDGERSSPKNGSNLAGKCPPPPQAAGQPTLRDGSTSNGTSAGVGQRRPMSLPARATAGCRQHVGHGSGSAAGEDGHASYQKAPSCSGGREVSRIDPLVTWSRQDVPTCKRARDAGSRNSVSRCPSSVWTVIWLMSSAIASTVARTVP